MLFWGLFSLAAFLSSFSMVLFFCFRVCGVDDKDQSPITVTSAMSLSGQPKDVSFLSESGEWLVREGVGVTL